MHFVDAVMSVRSRLAVNATPGRQATAMAARTGRRSSFRMSVGKHSGMRAAERRRAPTVSDQPKVRRPPGLTACAGAPSVTASDAAPSNDRRASLDALLAAGLEIVVANRCGASSRADATAQPQAAVPTTQHPPRSRRRLMKAAS